MGFNEFYALGFLYIESRSIYLTHLVVALFFCIPIILARLYYIAKIKQIAPKANVEELGILELIMMMILIFIFPLVGILSVMWLVMRQTYIEAKR
ncbi:TPA: hypothetical protein I7730_00685 [Vibrio vulnificus]|uniref:Uncharacterized protein n=1 Tax=Vibrio vulnificus TaxID=672 RepID=A0A8H9K5A8_VIBVL|nr:hypothetical protein [Vibrio vulnificus]